MLNSLSYSLKPSLFYHIWNKSSNGGDKGKPADETNCFLPCSPYSPPLVTDNPRSCHANRHDARHMCVGHLVCLLRPLALLRFLAFLLICGYGRIGPITTPGKHVTCAYPLRAIGGGGTARVPSPLKMAMGRA